MKIRALKLSNNKKKEQGMSGSDILDIYVKEFQSKGKVTYSTGVPIRQKPEKILLTLGNVVDKLYLCEIDAYDYKGKGILFRTAKQNIIVNTPKVFRNGKNVSWLLFKSMKEISIDYFGDKVAKKMIENFIKSRANNKTLNIDENS